MEDKEMRIRDELSGSCLRITEERSFMFDDIDSFVALSRENTSVKMVALYPFDSNAGNYDFWDKVGQIVGNLTELHMIFINFLPYRRDDDGDEARRPDWNTLTRILPYVRHKISLSSGDYDANVEEIQGLARAIHGHPMILGFICEGGFTFANLGPWCSALATLPSLERIAFGVQEPETEDQRDLVNLEPLKELLRTPALRFVTFQGFYFTNELCHATANALGKAIIANALKTNATVTDIKFFCDCGESLCNTLAAVLLCNSTLQNITLQLPEENASGRWLCPIFLSLGMNTTLKSLSVNICDKLGDELCAAIRNGLAKNSTLEDLSLEEMLPSDDDGAVSARNALSFLRTNSTLKSLTVSFTQTQKESYHVSAFRLEAVKILENTFLESLTIMGKNGIGIEVEELLALVSALQLNTTLKTLGFQPDFFQSLRLTDDEGNRLVSVLMKNYGLERLVPGISCTEDGRVKAILMLNAAGRRYLIKDGSSISKGVDVLSAVSDEIDCVFLHLLENPSLCDRRAADTTPSGRRPGATFSGSSSTGKRERALSQPGKETHCRLA
jgi:hypothetical protein